MMTRSGVFMDIISSWRAGCKHSLTFSVAFLMLLHCVSAQSAPVLSYSVLEERPKGEQVGNIENDYGLVAKYGLEISRQLQLVLMDHPKNYHQYFTIIRPGMLVTSSKIDRDHICPKSVKCNITLDITIDPPEYFEIIKVQVDIIDINDNAPSFPTNVFSRIVPENASPGSTFSISSATDVDSPSFGIKRYDLISSSDKFELDSESVEDIHLILKRQLDREQRDMYSLRVVAQDGGTPPKSATITINIVVSDVNDNSPQFDQTKYEVSIPENINQNVSILKVGARDVDSGANGEIVYSLSGVPNTDDDIFTIDQFSGEIYLMGNLDYERTTVYSLTVTARNTDPNSLPDTTKVVIRVQDINDNPPIIKLNTQLDQQGVSVSELAPARTFVAHLTIKDPDSGENGKFSCNIDSDQFQIQKLYPTEFKILTQSTLDREKISNYEIRLECRDHGIPSQTAVQKITVFVMDENDSPPSFSESSYTTSILENNGIGVSIVQITAIDEDEDLNAEVTYSLADMKFPYFDIDPRSGVVTARVGLDREEAENYELTVMATDRGVPALSSSVTLHVIVVDVDDEIPHFSHDVYNMGVFENEIVESEVGVVSALDRDSGPFNMFTYGLKPNHNHASVPFTINPVTGRIVTTDNLDREHIASYEMIVTATSRGFSPVTGSATVSVQVLDRNDNYPVITFPRDGNDSIVIHTSAAVGAPVSRILAYDSDIGSNSDMTFSIIAGNDNGWFTIDIHSGDITIAKTISNPRDIDNYLIVEVSDQGEISFSTRTMLNLTLIDDGVTMVSHLTIVIVIGCVCGVLTVILTVAIVAVFKHHQKKMANAITYSCHVVEQGKDETDFHKHAQLDDDVQFCQDHKKSGSGEHKSKKCKQEKVKINSQTSDIKHKSKLSQPSNSVEKLNEQSISIVDTKTVCTGQHDLNPCVDPSRYKLMYCMETSSPKLTQKGQLLPQNGFGLTAPVIVSDRDSDSGCSADMSQTTDSGRCSHTDEHQDNISKDTHFHRGYQSSIRDSQGRPPVHPKSCMSRDSGRSAKHNGHNKKTVKQQSSKNKKVNNNHVRFNIPTDSQLSQKPHSTTNNLAIDIGVISPEIHV